MGAIIKARHLSLNRDVAMKLMRNEISGVHKASERFLREARATANIESDYVARVMDIDVLPGGAPFIVMEFLDGEDLATHVARVRQRGVVEAVDWILQTLSGLHAAHKLGIVHRDLKPTNLFLVRRPDGGTRVKVLDFGVSKVLDDSDFSREGHNDGLTTASNFLVGTPRYMAPEQITAPTEVDERADLWAVGLILYEFLVGSHPFEGKTPGAIMGNVLSSPILPIDSHRRDVPLELAKVVEQCLQRDRSKRVASAAQLLRALAPFGSQELAASLVAILPREQPVVKVTTEPNFGGFAPVEPAQVPQRRLREAGPPTTQRQPTPSDVATVHTPSYPAAGGGTGSLGIPVSVAVEAGPPATLRSGDSGSGLSQPASAHTPSSATPRPAAPASSTPIGGTPASATPSSGAPSTGTPGSGSDPGTLLEWNQDRGREGSKKALLVTAAGLLLVAAAVAGLLLTRGAATPAQEPVSAAPAPYAKESPVPPPQLDEPVPAAEAPPAALNAQPAAPANASAPAPARPVVAPITSPATPTEAATAAPTAAAPPPAAPVAKAVKPTPASKPVAKKAAPTPASPKPSENGPSESRPSETKSRKDSILGTRN
jgi:serine/threonine-protein kinase